MIETWITSSTAWLVAASALVNIGANVRYLRIHPHGEKRYLRWFNILTAGYVLLLYVFLGSSVLGISAVSALLGRAAIVIALSLLTAETIADWK